jgi:glutamate-1-semialdehyde 2,1-aminomutase
MSAEAKVSDTRAFARFFHSMLDPGVVLPPSQFEAWFVSAAHDDRVIEETLEAAGSR